MVRDRKVLRLKCICKIFGISSQDIASGVPMKMHRNYVSNAWNLLYLPTEQKQEAMINFLISEGVPEGLARTAFEKVFEFEETEKLGAILGRGEEISATEDFDILKLGVMMIRTRIRQHFGIRHDPFQQQRNDVPFQSRAFLTCREAIEDTIHNWGFLGIAGPTGSGKSVLWTYVNQRLADNQACMVVTVKRFDKNCVRPGDIYRSLLIDLAKEPERIPNGNENKHRRVEELLIENAVKNVNTVVLINEAHDLSTDSLVMLKRLWEAFNDSPGMGYARACTVIMLGQEMLAAALRSARPELREVVQRVDLERYGALSRDEIGPYLAHRFRRDNGAFQKIFEPDAIEYMADLDVERTPQMINVVASNAIYNAYQVGAKTVTAEHVARLRRG